jgi:aspartyl-tRNA synthetase
VRRRSRAQFFDKLNDWARSEGAPGLGYIVFDKENGAHRQGPIAKFLPADRSRR